MQRQAYIQLHALLCEIRDHVEEEHDVPDDAFDAYDALSVRPVHVHLTKEQHERAIGLLLVGIGETIDEPPRDSLPPAS
ncbi:UPF0058 family protein [Natribaculum luteum]|uniref:UPF0058 family protein n=1 Tax=Natribaculum luteum TaxID=1586232 RepID=A0ABD5NYG6_9EURY|nr:UPF0058 family protein [Natribaculum luteum]